MNTFVQILLATHPAGGGFRKEASGKKKKKASSNSKFFSSPDSYHSRNGVTKRENPRFNPAP